ncbi:MAG: polynucleotide kinase-phosphatase, partial [Bacteroidota bacterium]
IDEYGLPVRYNWASEYRGRAKVVYGHTPVPAAEWLNRTIDIDTGCVFGGKLTALRYPEEELVSVPAKQVYYEPAKPLIPEVETGLTHQQENDDLLHIEDVIGKRIVQTRLRNNLTISAEHSAAALEVMSRFAIHPKWLMYLPPTMSPGDTSELEGYLEHPNEALNYYRKQGIKQVICEEKHMGSRAILVLCKDASVSQARFGITSGKLGVCYTRTGRNFFKDSTLEQAFIERVVKALGTAQFWERFGTDWVCLDAELMPWSAKAQALLKEQYAAVGAAGTHALAAVEGAFRQMATRKVEGVAALQARFQQKYQAIGRFRESYRAYCWEVTQLEDYQLAPFHILATEMQVHTHQSHRWHMEEIHRICAADPRLLKATAYQIADLEDAESCAAAVQWWLRLTANGGEGMVVKPADFIAYGKKGLIQPAVKCRGKEYLRIIYGPDYDAPENLKRLRQRGLGSKRSLALREFALSVESLERFVRKEPLRRVHEAVFGVLALESEPVDPRL